MKNFVVLKTFYHKHEALMAQGLLQEAGIPSTVQADDCGGYRPHLTLGIGNVRLLVPDDQIEAAQAAIAVLEETPIGISEDELNTAAEAAPKPEKPSRLRFPPGALPWVGIVVILGLFMLSYVRSEYARHRMTRRHLALESVPNAYDRYNTRREVTRGDGWACTTTRNTGDILSTCKEFYNDGTLRSLTNYKNNLPDGRSQGFHPNGQLASVETFVNGKGHGEIQTFYENGQLESAGTQHNDKYKGRFEEYYETGELMGRGFYANHEFHGPYVSYYKDGSMAEELTYEHGRLLDEDGQPLQGRQKTFYQNGNLWKNVQYKDGRMNGVSRGYYDDGVLEWEAQYRDNELVGKVQGFHKNRILKYTAVHKDSRTLQSIEEYDDGGNKIFQAIY